MKKALTGKKSLLTRYLPLLSLVIILAGLFGCSEAGPSDICSSYFAFINAGDYKSAYSLLHSGVRYDEAMRQSDEAEGKAQPAKRISEAQFEERYAKIFEVLEIEGLSYSMVNAVEGEIISVFDYDVRYKSGLTDFETMTMRVSMRMEDGLWKIEWTPALIFPEMEWGDTVRVGRVDAVRGEILADGVAYSESVNAVSICAAPGKICEPKTADETEEAYELRKETAYEQFARQITLLLPELKQESVIKQLDTQNALVILTQMYPDEYTESLEEQLLTINGVSVDNSNFGTLRNHPQKSTLAHIVGYVGAANEEDLLYFTGSEEGDETYDLYSVVGKSGLERVYEKELRGTDGYYIFICSTDGENRRTLYRTDTQNGLDLQLTIDPNLQELSENLLKYSLFGIDTAGAVVVMDPTTGRIEAMAAYPSYDLNLFTRGISAEDWDFLNNPEKTNRPLYNRLTRGLYPPGSTFKPFTAAAVLHYGIMSPDDVFPEDKERIEDDKWRPSDNGEFGVWHGPTIARAYFQNRRNPMNMHHGMIYSDNIYFAYIGLKLGADKFKEYMEPLGFTESIPFDLPVAAPQLSNENALWDDPLLAASAYGQGEILITPLQAAGMFCAFATGGTIMEPYVVKGLYKEVGPKYEVVEEKEPKVWKSNLISKRILDTLAPMLEDVSVTGTAQWLGLKRTMRIASKTGTAQLGGARDINWFVGYRLEGDPRLVLVMLEVPDNGMFNMAKFDIARELFLEGFTKEEAED